MRPILSVCLMLGAFTSSGFGGTASAPVTLVNAHVEVGVDPARGLILGFGRAGGKNLLWLNPHPLSSARHSSWVNYGGDKLWWGPFLQWQAIKGRLFPPEEAFDEPWEITVREANRLVIRSAMSDWVGVRAEREIALSPDEDGIVIRNRFLRERPSAQPLQLWTVCQLPPPRWCWLDSQPAAGEAPFVNLRPQFDTVPFLQTDVVAGLIRCAPADYRDYMIGTRGAWIAAVYDDFIIVHQVGPWPDGDYSEQVSLQLFATRDYIELETLSGLANPAVGEGMSNTVRWRLLDRPPGMTEAELGLWLRRHLTTEPE